MKAFTPLMYIVLLTITSVLVRAQETPQAFIGGEVNDRVIEYTYDASGNRSRRQTIINFGRDILLPELPDPYIDAGDGRVEPEKPGGRDNPAFPRPGGERPPFAYSGWVPDLLFYRYDYLKMMNSL